MNLFVGMKKPNWGSVATTFVLLLLGALVVRWASGRWEGTGLLFLVFVATLFRGTNFSFRRNKLLGLIVLAVALLWFYFGISLLTPTGTDASIFDPETVASVDRSFTKGAEILDRKNGIAFRWLLMCLVMLVPIVSFVTYSEIQKGKGKKPSKLIEFTAFIMSFGLLIAAFCNLSDIVALLKS